jgi:hypothetical protein
VNVVVAALLNDASVVNDPIAIVPGGQGTLACGPEGPLAISGMPVPHPLAVFFPYRVCAAVSM